MNPERLIPGWPASTELPERVALARIAAILEGRPAADCGPLDGGPLEVVRMAERFAAEYTTARDGLAVLANEMHLQGSAEPSLIVGAVRDVKHDLDKARDRLCAASSRAPAVDGDSIRALDRALSAEHFASIAASSLIGAIGDATGLDLLTEVTAANLAAAHRALALCQSPDPSAPGWYQVDTSTGDRELLLPAPENTIDALPAGRVVCRVEGGRCCALLDTPTASRKGAN